MAHPTPLDNDEMNAMAEGNGDVSTKDLTDRSQDYSKLIAYGLDTKVAGKLDEIYQTGKLAHVDLDDRALDALKEFPVDGALNVLGQFLESNLEHVSNKSAYLCGVMKTYRQRRAAAASPAATPPVKAPDEDKIKAILDRTGYTLDVTTGQRKYGGPPPNWTGPSPGTGCEVFCGKIPRDMYEDELIPLFEKCGLIWDLRLMMDPMTGQNRGYAFVTFTTRDAAHSAVKQLDNHEIKPGKGLKVNISVPNLRLFVGNIPKSKGKDEIFDEFNKLAAGLTDVIIYSSPDDKKKNRGFCFLEYDTHKAASVAKRRLGTGRVKVWGCDIIVDWADPQEEPDPETMSKVKVLYVRNLTQDCSEEKLKETFEAFGKVERVKKIKDYAFVHFEDREDACRALAGLNGHDVGGANIEVSLAKPPSDKKKKEEVLRARERRMMHMMQGRVTPTHPGMMGAPLQPMRGPRGSSGSMRGSGIGRGDFGGFSDPDYSYDGVYLEYRGGYNDPYLEDFYEESLYDYAPPPRMPLRPRRALAGRGPGVGVHGRVVGPRPRLGPSRVPRPALIVRGVPAPRTLLRANPNLHGNNPGKRKSDGCHHQGASKRRYQKQLWGGYGGWRTMAPKRFIKRHVELIYLSDH